MKTIGMFSCRSGQGHMAGSCGHGNVTSNHIMCRNCFVFGFAVKLLPYQQQQQQ
jgi:hypothetical protein